MILTIAFAGSPALAVADEVSEKDLARGDLLAPKAFRIAARKVLPSVVYIESFGGVPSGQGKIGGIRRPGDGPTTGLIVSSDGYIVTSTFNFIQKPPIITVHLRDGTQHVAKLVGRDDTRKICLLKVEDVKDLPLPEIVPRPELKVGQWAISVGVGFGDKDPALSAGIISATSRINGRAIQTDSNTSPVNYGGPLIDIEGRVIGICAPLSPQSQEVGSGVEWYDSGIGFAVPLHGAEHLLAAMKAGKTIRAGYLGIALKRDAKEPVISKVNKNTAADKAGIKAGDKIIAIDGKVIVDGQQLRNVVGGYIEGDEIEVVVQRKDEEKQFKVKLTAAPQQPQVKITPGARPKRN